MRRFVDLHTHSTASDGAVSPRELVRLAEAKRLAAIALTDHDTLAGLREAADEAKRHPDLRFVPGIEVSARFPSGTMHILGLGIDEAAAPLGKLIATLRAARDERNPKIIAALQSLGYPIDMDDVLAAARCRGLPRRSRQPTSDPDNGRDSLRAGRVTWLAAEDASSHGTGRIPLVHTDETPVLREHTVGRVHIAEALRRKGCVASIAEAFERLIGHDGPAYVDKERLDPPEVVRAIADSGGAAVLAHPPQLLYENLAQLERIVKGLAGHGLAAIEAYHSDNTPEQTRAYMKLARKYRLGVTGGSDFHGPAKPDVRLGRPPVPLAALEGRLREIVMGAGG